MHQPITTEYIDDLAQSAIEQATVHLRQGHFDLAESLLRQVEKVGRETNHTVHLLSLALHRQGKNKEALDLMMGKLFRKDEHDWEHWNTLGVVLSSLHNHQEAVAAFKMAISCDNKAVMPRSNLALEYHATGCYENAEKCIKEAMLLGQEHRPMLYFNMGNLMLDQQMPKTAISCFTRTLNKLPQFHAARWNRSAALLMTKQYEKGFVDYESRWEVFPHFTEIKVPLNKIPDWEGESLDEKTILLYCEQGTGDCLQFIRFTKHLKEQGARVIFDWKQTAIRGDLTSILQKINWIDKVIDVEKMGFDQEQIDFKQSLMSLPFHLKLYSEKQMQCDQYIRADEKFSDSVYRIGICWSGSPQHHKDSQRSCDVSHFGEFCKLGDNVKVLSLQRQSNKQELADMNIIQSYLNTWDDTHKLISQMDIVVTVDTAVLHLAGAMGKRTIALIPFVPDWRWGLESQKTVWYPSVTLLRQKRIGDWADPFNRAVELVKHELEVVTT